MIAPPVGGMREVVMGAQPERHLTSKAVEHSANAV
jgi:hypothetical protein